jgi:hypothetical protein
MAGRPRAAISKEWLQERVDEGLSDREIAAALALEGIRVSAKTIQRRRVEFGIRQKVSDQELKQAVERVKGEGTTTELGHRMVKAKLESQGVKVGKKRIQRVMREVDSGGVERRKMRFSSSSSSSEKHHHDAAPATLEPMDSTDGLGPDSQSSMDDSTLGNNISNISNINNNNINNNNNNNTITTITTITATTIDNINNDDNEENNDDDDNYRNEEIGEVDPFLDILSSPLTSTYTPPISMFKQRRSLISMRDHMDTAGTHDARDKEPHHTTIVYSSQPKRPRVGLKSSILFLR